MTTELMTRFVERRPFIPFQITTVDGRTIRFPHSDYGTLERYATSVLVFDDMSRAEIIDVAVIVSLKTLEPLPDDSLPDSETDQDDKE